MTNLATLPTPSRTPGESIRYWTYRCLLDSIVTIRLEPGQPLAELDVGDWLGISRTPVRDALFQLSQERFVTIVPQSRTYVAKIDMDVVEDARYIRRCVEIDIVRKIAGVFDEEHLLELRYIFQRQELAHKRNDTPLVHALDEEFHRTLFDIVGMRRMWEKIDRQNLHFQRVRNLYLLRNKNTDHVIAQHRELLAALEAGDFALAQERMGAHLSAKGWDIAALREAYPGYFAATP